jgi:hypothetical protein
MKDWFPLTNYEFYAYVATGVILIAAVDYSFAGAVLSNRTEWTVVETAFWLIVAYLLGQICAAPSSAILEHWLARRVFHAPVEIALGSETMRARELFIARLFANREYSPLSADMRKRIADKAAEKLGRPQGSQLSGEAVFEVAFPAARASADTVARLEQFLSLYGFSRNICFASLIALISLAIRLHANPDKLTWCLLAGTIVLCLGMYGRFIKFYAAYSREVLRSYGAA